MDVVADADGYPDQDIRRFPNYEDKPEEGMEIQYDLVLGDRLCCIENQYTDLFCNPMLMWGSYRRGFFRTTLPISFQFHHVQMDGGEAARFMELLQVIIRFLQ